MVFTKTTSAREGREHQVYTKDGARVVAGCVCLDKAGEKVLMINSSTSKDKWILPKGGVETDENFEEAAQRETWEEAGCVGDLVCDLGIVIERAGKIVDEDEARITMNNSHAAPDTNLSRHIEPSVLASGTTEFHFYEMIVKELPSEFPEAHRRERRWCTYQQARELLQRANRPGLVTALDRSSINR